MTLVLSHKTALEHYRNYEGFVLGGFAPGITPAPESPTTIPKHQAKQVLSQPPSVYEVRELLNTHSATFTSPLHVVVSGRNLQRPGPQVSCHVGANDALPSYIVKANSQYYACSPLLALVQCAQLYTVAQVAQWCSEFCGTYRLETADRGFNKALPLVSRRQLRRFARDHSNIPGCNKLGRIARYISDGAASPMETALSLLLSMPVRWGGYGLPLPQLNAVIELPRDVRLRSGKNYFVADLLWPDRKLVVEYDSNEFHTGKERITSDAMRRNILTTLGYTVITVVSDQLFSQSKADELALQLLKHLGIRKRATVSDYYNQKLELRQTLLPNRF